MNKLTAVIVEDDLALSELYKTVLEQSQYEVERFDSGLDAQRFFQNSIPDLIILDAHLPFLSGVDILEKLQADERFDDTLILMVTADIYIANQLKGKIENIILKTHGIDKIQRLAREYREAKAQVDHVD